MFSAHAADSLGLPPLGEEHPQRVMDQFDVREKSSEPDTRSTGWLRGLWKSPPMLLWMRRAQDENSSKAPRDSVPSSLERVIDELQSLNENTEVDFLKIGAKLMEFLQSADSISSGISQLAAFSTGEQGNRASHVLTIALDRCRQMEERTAERGRNLGTLRAGAVSVRNAFAGFREAVSTFRVICTLTRIETARLGANGADLCLLAESVKSLAEAMGSKVESVLDSAALLDQRIEDTVKNLSGIELMLKDLALVISGVMTSLGAFADQQAGAAALSLRLVSDSNSVSNSIKDTVMSIQFHDITRQQVEHVVDALQHICNESKGGSSFSADARAVLALEASQLSDAERKFATSVGRLMQNLDNVAASVREMAKNGNSLLDTSANEQDSFVFKMEQCLMAILTAVDTHDKAAAETEDAAGKLGETLSAMQNAAEQVRDIDTQLLRVALNANLQACNLGVAGETLSVLAGALQDLAMGSHARSDAAGGSLDSMSAAVSHLSRRAEDSVDVRVVANQNTVVSEMKSEIAELHSWSHDSDIRIKEIATLASSLCDDILSTLSGFTAGRLFTDVVTRSLVSLTEISAGAGSTPSIVEIGAAVPGLQQFARRYTMQSERDVHTNAIGGGGMPPPPHCDEVLSEPAHEERGELGDNVELF